jgi:hypothetical protein
MSINPNIIHPDIVAAAEREDKRLEAESFSRFLADNNAERRRCAALTTTLKIRIPPLTKLQAQNQLVR